MANIGSGRGYCLSYHGTSSDRDASTDRYALKHRRIGANPDVLSDANLPCKHRTRHYVAICADPEAMFYDGAAINNDALVNLYSAIDDRIRQNDTPWAWWGGEIAILVRDEAC